MFKNRKKTIAILEDDDGMADLLASAIEIGLSAKFELEVLQIETEAEFQRDLNSGRFDSPVPDAFLFDVRVRWTYSGSGMAAPTPEFSDQTLAGIRCYDAIQQRYPSTTTLLYTVLQTPDLVHKLGERAKHYSHVPKTSGPIAIVNALLSAFEG